MNDLSNNKIKTSFICKNKTLCKIAFDRLASFPPFKRSPFPLRIAKEAIYSNDKKDEMML